MHQKVLQRSITCPKNSIFLNFQPKFDAKVDAFEKKHQSNIFASSLTVRITNKNVFARKNREIVDKICNKSEIKNLFPFYCDTLVLKRTSLKQKIQPKTSSSFAIKLSFKKMVSFCI